MTRMVVAEVWKTIPGFPNFQASSAGSVRSLDRAVAQVNRWGKPMLRFEPGCTYKQRRDKDGYLRINVNALPTVQVHRLVAMAFIPNRDGKPQVNHKDGVVVNNVPGNLEWATNSENHLHAYRVLGRKPSRSGQKVTMVYDEQGNGKQYSSATEAAAALRRGPTAVTNAIRSGGKVAGCRVAYV